MITGIPGVGKTSLIVGVAREAAAVGREVLWLDAADPVASTAALRARFPSSEVSLWNALRARLAADPTLLVLLDDASRATLPLELPSYLAGSLVATSRERVWPPPWRIHELAPLAEDDAVRLLADTSGVALTDELRSLARFAAGLPLALVQIGLFLRSTGLAPILIT